MTNEFENVTENETVEVNVLVKKHHKETLRIKLESYINELNAVKEKTQDVLSIELVKNIITGLTNLITPPVIVKAKKFKITCPKCKAKLVGTPVDNAVEITFVCEVCNTKIILPL